MSARRSLLFGCTLLGIVSTARAQVASIQVAPASAQLSVGGTTELLASAYDARGGLVPDVSYRWISGDPSVVRVEADPALPSLATITGLAPGVTTVEVRVGGVSKVVAVSVTGAAPALVPQRRPELPDTVMAPGVSDRGDMLSARVLAYPFQSSQRCASAFLVSGAGLFLTSYRAIRGADRLELEYAGRTITDVRIAAYSVQNDVAVLQVPGVTQTDSLRLASRVVDQQVVWAFGHPRCGSVAARRTAIAGQQAGGGPNVRVSNSLSDNDWGAPLVTQNGEVMAVVAAEQTAVGAPLAAEVLGDARSNLRLRSLLTPAEVGRRENHLYGSLAITSGVAATVARVSPLERWQWPETAAEGATPFTFTGPMGRYRVELVQNGAVRSSTEVTVQPGEVQPVPLSIAVAQGPAPQQPQAPAAKGGGGGFPVALVILGLAGAGAGAYFALAGGGGGSEQCPSGQTGTPPNCTPINNPTTGGIVISVPNP